MKSPLLALFALAFTLALCGCGGGSQPVSEPSGIRGVAVIAGADSATPQGVLPNATISVQKQNPSIPYGANGYGPVTAQTQTDAQGNFSITLPAGSYQLTGSVTQPVSYRTGVVSVNVSPNHFLQVTLTFVKS